MNAMPTAICTARVPRISLSSSYTMIETIRMSSTSHQVTGGRCRSSVSRDTRDHYIRGSDPRCLSNRVGDADHLHHFGHPVDADDVRAAEDGGGHGGGGRPVARLGGQRTGRRAVRNDLRDGPTSIGQPSSANRLEARQRGQALCGALGEAEAGVDDDAGRRVMPAPSARSTARCRSRRPRRRRRCTRRGRTCRASARACASARRGAPAAATSAPRPASY